MRQIKKFICRNYKTTVWLLFLLLISNKLFAQQKIVKGQVFDATTNQPLPFVNISFVKTPGIGTVSDINGKFIIKSNSGSDSLKFTCIGFKRQSAFVSSLAEQYIQISLKPENIRLNEVVVVAPDHKEDMAISLIKKVIKHKKQNNPEKIEAYQYEVYNKVEFDVNNISRKTYDRKIMKPVEYAFSFIDTSSEEKPFLPVFLSETLSDFYCRKSPKAQKEIIKASKVSGTKNESISQLLGQMYQTVFIYDNFIILFSKSFVSPISEFGQRFYNYYLTDSIICENKKCYKIEYYPQRKQEPLFVGSIWVQDLSYAITHNEMYIAKEVNINYINSIYIEQDFSFIDDNWMVIKEVNIVDFSLTDRTTGFYGRRTTSYKDIILNQPKELSFYSFGNDIEMMEDAVDKDDKFWNQNRHEQLSDNENLVYNLIDTLGQVPAVKTYIDILSMIITGYKVLGPVELGPYFTTYSYNAIEGHRFRLGGRTGNDFSKRLMIEGYGAYGLKDQAYKFGVGSMFFLTKKPRWSIGIYYRDDLEQLGQSNNAFREDNIMSSFFRRLPFAKLTGIEEYRFYTEKEWFTGFSSKITFKHRLSYPVGEIKFEYNSPDGSVNELQSITTSEFILNTRFAYKERYIEGEFERTSLGTKYPVLQLNYSYGAKNIWSGAYEYHKLALNIEHWFYLKPFGWTSYWIDAGKIWGALPYPLLELHTGNETYSYDKYAFNLMNYYEFVSDEYISMAVTHHFDGYFFNKIPLMRKLKLREVITAKGVYGNLNSSTNTILNFPENMGGFNNIPYLEGGFGIENIFKIVRIDAIWRLTYLDHPNVVPWGIRGKMYFNF